MPRVVPLADQAAQFDKRAQSEAQRRVLRRATFNSRRMWLLVAIVWAVAAGMLAVGLARLG